MNRFGLAEQVLWWVLALGLLGVLSLSLCRRALLEVRSHWGHGRDERVYEVQKW